MTLEEKGRDGEVVADEVDEATEGKDVDWDYTEETNTSTSGSEIFWENLRGNCSPSR